MAFMADQESNVAAFGGSGGHGMSGSWSMIILVIVVVWLLFKDSHSVGHAGNGNYGHDFGNCHNIGVDVKDMPDYLVDRDVLQSACETRAVASNEGDKTRALISHNQERADDKAYQQLVMQSLQQENAIQTLKLENNFQTRLAVLGSEVERGFAGINHIAEGINCNMVKRPPYYAAGFVPCGDCVPPARGACI
jgi:hypothetical protein